MKYCKKCLMPSSRPRIVFDNDGICNGCATATSKKVTDWEERKLELVHLLDSKSREKHDNYDCVVAWSGGKDSSAVALKLREELGLNPLLVTFSPLIPTVEGTINRRRLQDLGFDQVMITPDLSISSKLSKRFFIERGDPKVHWNAGINSAPIQVARSLQIPFVFFAEHGESEYGGKILKKDSLRTRDMDEILENQIGDDPMNWISEHVPFKSLFHYQIALRGDDRDPQVLYFSYFFPWDIYENFKYVASRMNFQTAMRGRTYGTFTNFDSLDDTMDDLYYYMQYIKFGFGRCLRDCARQIQRGHMTKTEALELIAKFDGEFPDDSLNLTLDFLKMDYSEFMQVVDSHRRDDIWVREKESWKLRYPVIN